MAVNPITSDDLTIDMKSLLSIPVGDRVQAAASDPGFAQALVQSLTPIQMAKAFPDYYRKELPDISNFVLGNRYLDKVGSGGFDQRGGGNYGEQKGKAPPPLPKSIVDKILEDAKIYEATGKTGVTSAIKNKKGRVISTADVSMTPNERALLDTIAKWEAKDYNTSYGGARFEDFSEHPNMEVMTQYGKSDAAGRYQFLESTWNNVVRKYNNENPGNPITDFSPVNQDRAALWLAKSDYKLRTGRDLTQDLANPPENFGELIKAGLGGGQKGPTDTTWQALQFKNAREIQDVFNESVEKNTEYAKAEAEEAAKKETGPKIEVSPEVAEILNSNPETKKYFIDEKPDMGVRLQEQINAGIMSIDDLKNKVRSNSQQIGQLIRTTEEMAVIGGDSVVNPAQSRVMEDQQEIAGTRKLPIQEDLKNLMDFSAQKISEESGRNISMQVFSGGQAAYGTAGPRKGTTEHDLGGAGDVYFVEKMPDGSTRRLSLKNPEDKALMYKAAYHFARAGGRSVGLESGYMGDEAMHLGISRNSEDPVHHGDTELEALISQAKNEYLAEAREQGWDTRYGYKNYLEREKAARIAAYQEKNKDSAVAETPSGGKTMLISAGTNDWGNEDSEITYNNITEMAKQAQAKGYTPVIIAPVGTGKFQKVNAAANKAATDLGIKIEQPQEYDEDGYHPTQKEAKRLAELYPGSVAVGDSIANRIGTYVKDGQTVAVDGIQSGAALEKMTNEVAEVPAYQYGGSPNLQDDEDLTAVGSDGKPKFKFNSGEGLYVKPEANEYADDKISELSDRVDKMSETQQAPKQKEMPSSGPTADPKWADKVASAYRSPGTQQRAFNRAHFRSEGKHVGDRGSPNIA